MTKTFKFSSLLAVMLVAVSANIKAEEVFGEMNRAGCCPQTGPICDLKVKNNVWVGGTLNANNINVKCCGEKCPVMVTCERCVKNIRGSVVTQTPLDLSLQDPNVTFTAALNVVTESGCGFTATGNLQVLANNTSLWGPILPGGGAPAASTTASFTFSITLDKPCVSPNGPVVASTLKAGTNGVLVFQLPAGNAAVITVTTAVNTKTPTSFDLVLIANIFAQNTLAYLQLIELLANNPLELTGVDFVAQCALDCVV